MKELSTLAAGAPTWDAWQQVVRTLDELSVDAQASAARAFNEASAHWPTKLNPWVGFDGLQDSELRRSPPHWVKEIYSGQHAPKHSVLRVIDSPRRPMGAQKLENLLAPEARIENARQVGFDQAKVTSGFLKGMKGDGAWRRWTALRLWTCDMKASGLKLLGAADLSALEMLNLEQNRMGEEGLKGLAKAPGLKSLTAIHLGSNRLDASAAAALGAMDWARKLTWLNLAANQLHDPGLELLTQGALPALRELDLSHNHVGQETAAWSRGLPNLTALRMNNTNATGEGLAAMLPNLPALEAIVLDATTVGDRGAEAIAAAPNRWKTLQLQDSDITPAGLAKILASPSVESVERLVLGSGFDLANAQRLIDGACPRLRFLWWNGSEIGEGVEKALRADKRLAATLPH